MLMAMAVSSGGTLGKCSSVDGNGFQSRKKMGCLETPSSAHSQFREDPWRKIKIRFRASSKQQTKKICRCSTVSRARNSSSSSSSSEKRKLSESITKLELAAEVSPSSFGQILRACGELKAFEEGRRVHAQIEQRGMERDLYLQYSLVRMYLRCRGGTGIAAAKKLFFSMGRRDVVLWTEMISAHARLGQSDAALDLYKRMRVEGVVPNRVTFLALLGACSSPEMLRDGRVVHARIIEQGLGSDVAVINAVLKMYIGCGSAEEAGKVFESMQQRDLVSWTTMIMSLGQDGFGNEAVKLFRSMLLDGIIPDCIACVALINACAAGMVIEQGRWIHTCVLESGFYKDAAVGISLINMYGKCGSVDEAKAVFDELSSMNPSVVFWTTMMAAYSQNCFGEAIDLFRKMQLEGIKPNGMTFATVMNSCADFSAIGVGRSIQGLVIESGFDSDQIVANSIVTMFGRCGDLVSAREMFDKMIVKETSIWNAMITAYAQHGIWDESLKMFFRMKQLGEKPNKITLVGVLSSCAHAGFVEEGCEIFTTMRENFGVDPTLQHYGCLIDLLGRAGWLRDAEEMIRKMPFAADSAIWTALFGTCRTHGDLEGARRAAEAVVEIEPENSGMIEFLECQRSGTEGNSGKTGFLDPEIAEERADGGRTDGKIAIAESDTETRADSLGESADDTLETIEEQRREEDSGADAETVAGMKFVADALEPEGFAEDQHPEGFAKDQHPNCSSYGFLPSADSEEVKPSSDRCCQASANDTEQISSDREDDPRKPSLDSIANGSVKHGGVDQIEQTQDQKPQNGLAADAARVEEEFRAFVHGDCSGALAKRLLWLTVMAVSIQGTGLFASSRRMICTEVSER